MAENTSVGSVHLGVEVNPNSISKEINKFSNAFGSGLKNMFRGMTNQSNSFVKESIGKMNSGFKNFGQTGSTATDKVAKGVSKMNAEYEKTESQISVIRKEMFKLSSEQDEIARGFQGLPALSGMTQDETMDHMLKSYPRYNELSEQIDKLAAKMDPLVDKNKVLAEEIKSVGDAASDTGNNLDLMGKNSNKAGNEMKKATWKTRLFGDEMKSSGVKSAGFAAMINNSFRSILRRLFVYNLIMKGIRGVMSYMGAALSTNAQFVHSLNVVKTNLMVAFQPIFTYILPALNALMRAVAMVTTYIATAISALFGKTYKQSFNAAKRMNDVAKSIGGAGKAAKGAGKAAKKAGQDAKKALAGFDEINTLDLKDNETPDIGSPDAGGGAGGFEMTMPDMSTIDMAGIEKFKEILSKIFEPFKLAWANEGQATIDAMKYALSSIWELAKAIGRSWLEVWTNGTGQAILETILRVAQNIFNTIGDIAGSFTKAWTEGERGTAIMQHIHNIILHLLTLVERVTGAFRDLWGNVGDTLARIFLETLKNVLGVLDHLAEKLVWVWDNGGKHLFEGLGRLVSKVMELAGYIINEFIVPLAHGFIEIAAPAVAELMDWTGWLLDKLSDLIGWLLGDGKPVLDTIVAVVGGLAVAFKVVTTAVQIFQKAKELWMAKTIIAQGVAGAFKGAIAALTTPFGIAVLAIGAAIAIAVLLWKNWEKIGPWLKNMWQSIKDKAVEIFDKVGNTIKKSFETAKEFITNIWNGIKEFLSNLWTGLISTASAIFKKVWNAIKNVFSATASWFGNIFRKAWDNVKNAFSGVTSFFQGIWNTITRMFNKIGTTIGKGIGDAFKFSVNAIIRFAESTINGFIRSINRAIKLINKIPGVNISTLAPLNIPKLAKGGIIDQPTLAMVGEAGKEAVMPLENNTGWITDLAGQIATIMGGTQNNDDFEGDSGDIVIMVSEDEFARIAINAIRKRQRKSGSTTILPV